MSKKPSSSPQPNKHYKGGDNKSGEKTVDLSAPRQQHSQGKYAGSAPMSDNAEKPIPRTQERGIGSSFAMAVDHLMNNAKNVKEQGKEFTDPNVATIPANTLGREFGKSFQPASFDHTKKLSQYKGNKE
jgi:hypothetical protein